MTELESFQNIEEERLNQEGDGMDGKEVMPMRSV